MRKIRICWLLSVCLLSGLSYPSFLSAQETTITFAAELTGDQLYEQGLNLNNQEKYVEAIVPLEEAIKRKSNFAEGYYQLGVCYLKTKQFDKAKQSLILAKVLSQNKELKDKSVFLISRIPEEIEMEKQKQEHANQPVTKKDNIITIADSVGKNTGENRINKSKSNKVKLAKLKEEDRQPLEETIGKPSFFYPQGTENWKIYTSKHYIFHYPSNSTRSKDMNRYLKAYAQVRDDSFEKICIFLNIAFEDRIDFFLYNSNEHGKQVTGRDLGFARYDIPNHIYEIHEQPNQSPGHETTHILQPFLGIGTRSALIGEGLAVYMNWKCGNNISKTQLRKAVESKEFKTLSLRDFEINFRSYDGNFPSYPLAGSFVGFLIEEEGLDKFKTFVQQVLPFEISINQVYGSGNDATIKNIERNWKQYIISHINNGVYKISPSQKETMVDTSAL